VESGREQIAKLGGGKLATLADLRGEPTPVKPPRPPDDPADDAPEFPHPLGYLWDIFREIADAVRFDDHGAAQVTWSEIRSWSELMQTALEPWEIRALVDVGRVGQTVAAKAYSDRLSRK